MPATWSQWPWLSTIVSMSFGDSSSRRMFSTTPVGVTPASNRIARSRPPVVTRTSAEKPGWAIRASGRPSVTAESTRGRERWCSQVVRPTFGVGKISGSVTLSIRIVIRTASMGASGMVTKVPPSVGIVILRAAGC